MGAASGRSRRLDEEQGSDGRAYGGARRDAAGGCSCGRRRWSLCCLGAVGCGLCAAVRGLLLPILCPWRGCEVCGRAAAVREVLLPILCCGVLRPVRKE